MCGIVGYIGKNKASGIILQGLKTLEYRGYDSCGIATIDKGILAIKKDKGKIQEVDNKLDLEDLNGQIGVGHTRWATHGAPSAKNAHPHLDCHNKIAVVHNGIIENYQELKDQLIKEGHKFRSDTDTEVAAHLIEKHYKLGANNGFEQAVIKALHDIRGAYALVAINSSEPGTLVAATIASPLILGLGKDEFILASDPTAIAAYTKKVIYLDDGDVAIIKNGAYRITNLAKASTKKKISIIEWDQEKISKAGYKHFMLKEIHSISQALVDSTRGRMIISEGMVKLGGLESVQDRLKNLKRLIITSCGTARHAGMVGEYMLEEYANIDVDVEYASEFRYRKMTFNKNDAVMALSQSGETADTLGAIKEAHQKGILTLGLVNVVGSTISRETDAGVYNHIGPELAVASTKAFISQVIILALLTVFLGRRNEMSLVMGKRILTEINQLPKKMDKIFLQENKIKRLAKKYCNYKDFLFLGRKYNHALALEGALKLKEVSYIHAEGYPSGELKHGPIAMIDKNFPSIVIAPNDSVYEKNLSSIEEIKARSGKVISIVSAGDKKAAYIADDYIEIPKTLEMLTPVLAAVPLYLFSYYVAVNKGLDPDKPRNLAKSVTVE